MGFAEVLAETFVLKNFLIVQNPNDLGKFLKNIINFNTFFINTFCFE